MNDVSVTLDQGNSSTKLVVYDWDSRRELHSAVLMPKSNIREAIEGFNVRAAIGCSVAHNRTLSTLLSAINAPVSMQLTPETNVGLVNLYDSPETLGADRLAAAVGAASLIPGRDLLVADIGTASTFDLVSAAGEYLGGNISPGPGMRLRALNHFTARLPLVSGHSGQIPPVGRNTADALRSGAMRGVVAELLYYSDHGRSREIVLSGGWAPEIAALLPPDVKPTLVSHLVNIGLNHILHSNL
ncbi:MAG: type III pantothenate kinase [Muribaculaceae bacterium]|nr:type III pantothenate kinase [Muribaculaceae bacterium]